MKLYSENKDYKLYEGSMLDMLEVIDPQSIDSIVCDPPYELNFMGKCWDNSGIAFQPDTWKKCYEVLKPGGYLLAFGGSRTFHRIACAIEDAGFEIRDTIMWLYGSGFPKSMDISKSLDKRNGRNVSEDFINYLNKARNKKGYSLADINKLMGLNTNGGGFASNIMGNQKKFILPTKENYLKLKKVLDLDDSFDNLIFIEEAEREVIGKGKRGKLKDDMFFTKNIDKAKETGKAIGYGEWDITVPSTDLAKQWQGWGTALKPSFEPIIVARKPFKGSLVDNVIEYGVGGINIDECRVGNEIIKGGTMPKMNSQSDGINLYNFGKHNAERLDRQDNIGRFPANTILTYDETDFDEVCGGFPDTKGGKRHNTVVRLEDSTSYGGKAGSINTRNEFNDSGSASRYFYCAKASKKDRDEGLNEFEEKNMRLEQNRQIHSAGCEYIENGKMKQNPHLQSSCKRNIHPTVKPTELMQYLVRLVSPNGSTILDPFNGSGSTGKAVMYENKERNKNYKYIGIELTEEYLPIAKARIEYVSNMKPDDSQMNIFDLLEKEDS